MDSLVLFLFMVFIVYISIDGFVVWSFTCTICKQEFRDKKLHEFLFVHPYEVFMGCKHE